MNKYKVLVHGKNYKFEDEFGELKKFGFYTHRYLIATDRGDVIQQANCLMCDEIKINFVNDLDDPGKITIEEIIEVETFGDVMVPGEGYTFYPMKRNIIQRVFKAMFLRNKS